ncbi:unnamed protein product, partial [Didymodactylos carnosus]
SVINISSAVVTNPGKTFSSLPQQPPQPLMSMSVHTNPLPPTSSPLYDSISLQHIQTFQQQLADIHSKHTNQMFTLSNHLQMLNAKADVITSKVDALTQLVNTVIVPCVSTLSTGMINTINEKEVKFSITGSIQVRFCEFFKDSKSSVIKTLNESKELMYLAR